MPSTVVLMLVVRGLPSNPRDPLKGIPTEVLVVFFLVEDPESSSALEPRGLCKCSRLAESSVCLTLRSDRILDFLSREAGTTDAPACKVSMSLGNRK